MQIEWVDGFEIRVQVSGGETTISANREGLLSLAQQPTAGNGGGRIIAQGSLEEGSAELIVERIP